MSFTALKGWNFHTETFDTLEDFLNPLKNTNVNLNRSCSVAQFFNGVAKIFDRDLTLELVKEWFGEETSWVTELVTKLCHDPRIHPYHTVGMVLEYGEDYEEEDDEYHTNFDHLNLTFQIMYGGEGGYMQSSRMINLDRDEQTPDEMVNSVVDLLHQRELIDPFDFTTMDHEYVINATDWYFNNQKAGLIWLHHFGRTTYRMYYEFESVLTNSDRALSVAQVISEFRPEHRIEVSRWDGNHVRWIVPTQTGDRRLLHRLHSYSTKASQLISGVLRQANELSDNLYGIELEVSTNHPIPAIIDAPEKTYCFVKQDSSISGSQRNMYEIVSIPCTMKVHIKSWAQIFEKLGYQGFDVTKNTTNGMHIHIDMAAFHNHHGQPDNLHLKHFCWFFINPVNGSFQLEISERNVESMAKYAQFPKLHHPTLPGAFKSTLDYTAHPFRGIVHFKQDRDTGRFITLECRMFKGIPSLANIVKNLEYVDSVFDFTRKTCFQSNTLANYLSYMDSTPSNKYTTLKEFLSRIGQDEIKESASLTQLLYGQADPEKILTTLHRNNITITSSNIHILNGLIPGVKFGLNKHGKLVVIETNRAKLYDMDLALQQRLTRFKGKAHVSHPHS